MAQDVEQDFGATEEVTTPEDSMPDETLAPENSTPERVEGEPDEVTENQETETPFDPEAEQTLEFNGKTYTLKGTELSEMLEKASSLAEKEKNLNRDYTQKTQELAEVRKSFESAFGGKVPGAQELQNLGQIYKAYFDNPQFQKAVDRVLSGQPLDESGSQGNENVDPTIAGLKHKIHQLESHLSQFTSSTEQRERERANQEGQRLFNSWLDGKKGEGLDVPENLIDPILETAGVLLKRNPGWDTKKALDEAYRRENIDNLENGAVKKALKKADGAKRTQTVKITPKGSSKPDSQKSYSEIIQESM